MTSPQPTPTKQPDSPEEKAWANAIASEHATDLRLRLRVGAHDARRQ